MTPASLPPAPALALHTAAEQVTAKARSCYGKAMSATNEKLETLFAKVRSLPAERQQAAIEALAYIAAEPYELSEDELGVLRPALERAQRGEYASDDEVSELLGGPWS